VTKATAVTCKHEGENHQNFRIMNQTTRTVLVSIFILVTITLIYFVFQISSTTLNLFNDLKETKYEIIKGEPLVLQDLNNKEIKLNFENSDRKIIHFWATHCKPCIQEMDSIAKYQNNLRGELYLVTLENPNMIKDYVASRKWELPIYTTDSTSLPLSPKEIKFYPSTFIIQEDSIHEFAIGTINWKEIK